MLIIKPLLIVALFFIEFILNFKLSSDSITTITTFFSIASGAYLTVLVVLFGSRVAIKLKSQKEKGTGHSSLDELCYRLQNSLILCLFGLFLGYIYSCIPKKTLLNGFFLYENQFCDIGFLFTFFISIIFVYNIVNTLKTAQYLIVLLKAESALSS